MIRDSEWWTEWWAERQARIAAGYVADGPQRHHGVCSESRPELGGRSCIELGALQPTLFGSGDPS